MMEHLQRGWPHENACLSVCSRLLSNFELSAFTYYALFFGLEDSRRLPNQLNTKLNPILTWLLGFTLSSLWPLLKSSFVVIDRCAYFSFRFTTLNRKRSKLLETCCCLVLFHMLEVSAACKKKINVSINNDDVKNPSTTSKYTER